MKYISSSIQHFLDSLAAKTPTPGGGSAAALAASIGAGLISMAANYTVHNPRYKDSSDEFGMILARSEEARKDLASLVDRDVEAYSALSAAMKKKCADPMAMDEAYKAALMPPFEVCKIAAGCLDLCDALAERGNRNLITDTAIAAIMLEGAFFSAKYNVYVNLKEVKDIDFIAHIHGILQPLEERLPGYKEEILEKCEDVISR